MRSKFLLSLLFVTVLCYSQGRQVITGRVMFNDIGIKDVLVINNNAQAETRTDSLGNFTLKATIGDLFVVSDPKVESKKIRYTPDQVKNGIFVIHVVMLATELEEVVINRSIVSTRSLGLVPENQVQYSVAERRLRAEFGAGFDLKNFMAKHEQDNGKSLGGRIKILFDNVLTERRLMLREKISMKYSNEQLVNEFKIPADKTEGFVFYISENKELAEALHAKDDSRVKFLISILADAYKKLYNE